MIKAPKYKIGDCFKEDSLSSCDYLEIINISPSCGINKAYNEKLSYFYFLKDVQEDRVTYDCCSEEYLSENCWLIENKGNSKQKDLKNLEKRILFKLT